MIILRIIRHTTHVCQIKSQKEAFVEKRAIIAAYSSPRPWTRVICPDEMGPVAAKTYSGAVWQQGSHRATFEPDYGHRGKVWVHSAFEPATGQAEIVISERRDSASRIALIEQVIEKDPSERWLLIEDNLWTHHSRDVKMALLAWPEVRVQFIPKYGCWWNKHKRPDQWKKMPQQQPKYELGAYSTSMDNINNTIST